MTDILRRNGKAATYGVRGFDGAIFQRPYGFAQRTNDGKYLEGPLRWTRFRARLDAKKFARKLTDA